MISYRLWQGRYGGEQGTVGSEILLNGEKYTVVGVMPSGFQFLQRYVAPRINEPDRNGPMVSALL